jgi:hypothetical protein
MKAVDQTFATVAADHANCSVGSYTHGLLWLEAAAQRDDIGTLLESDWVSLEDFEALPKVSGEPNATSRTARVESWYEAIAARSSTRA